MQKVRSERFERIEGLSVHVSFQSASSPSFSFEKLYSEGLMPLNLEELEDLLRNPLFASILEGESVHVKDHVPCVEVRNGRANWLNIPGYTGPATAIVGVKLQLPVTSNELTFPESNGAMRDMGFGAPALSEFRKAIEKRMRRL